MAVLPLLRRRGPRLVRSLDPTCLVIGAMAPDFEYFIHGVEQGGDFGHTQLGVWAWGVPVTLLVAVLFHYVVKQALWQIAPEKLARRTARAATASWPARWSVATIAMLVASAAIGNYTHLAWDGLTHAAGWAERLWPHRMDHWVRLPIIGYRMIFYRVLQYVSSVIGLAVLAWYSARTLARVQPVEVERRTRGPRIVFAGCVLAGIAVLTVRGVVILHAVDPGNLVVAPLSGLLAGTLVASAIVRARGAIPRA